MQWLCNHEDQNMQRMAVAIISILAAKVRAEEGWQGAGAKPRVVGGYRGGGHRYRGHTVLSDWSVLFRSILRKSDALIRCSPAYRY